jgi:predicted O-methyltransferase YrrM
LNIEKALAIPGFMHPIELEYLASIAEKATDIVEIGSWCGRSARAFADNTPGKVWAVDTWADNAYGSAPAEITCKPGWLMDGFARYHSDTIGSKVIRVRASSLEGSRILDYKRFDVIFIDAGHNYEDVRTDLLAWIPLLKDDGILCGHDYADYHPGVMKAVDEFVPKFRVVGTIWTTEGC